MKKITPFIWFDNQAEEAAKHYVSIFKNSKILSTSRYGEGSPGPVGSVMTISFVIDGQEIMALNGAPHFKLNEAFSLMVLCNTQAEIDELTDKLLSGGGEQGPCGWLKDKFGLSWQVVPNTLMDMLLDKDATKVDRVTKAFLQMKKFDIAALERAYEGRAA